jgi:glycosyltransferase involved in cell wall biosynthesis
MISVIIPTYKRAELITKSLETAISQSFTDIEIIVIDDNGINKNEQTDTAQNVNDFIRDNPNYCIKYVALEHNTGACFARNYGASISNGEYLAFLDDDDLWHIDKLCHQENILSSNPELSFCYCLQEYTLKKRIFKFYIGNIKSKIYFKNIVGGSSNPLIRKKYFSDVNGFDVSFRSCQDWDLWTRLIKTRPYELLNENLVTINNEKRFRISNDYKKSVYGHWQYFKKHWKQIIVNPYAFIIFNLKFLKTIGLYVIGEIKN